MAFLVRKNNTGEEHKEDRRVFARIKAEISARCCLDRGERRGRTSDISAQGIGIVSTEWIKPASAAQIFLKLPDSAEEFVTMGTVVWCRKVANGQFRIGLSLDRPEFMAVSQLLNEISKTGG